MRLRRGLLLEYVTLVWNVIGAPGIISLGFIALAIYIAAQRALTLSSSSHPRQSTLGIFWLAATVAAMPALAAGKRDTGRLDNPVLQTEARVTVIDGGLAAAVLLGVVLNAAVGWWWADPLAALIILIYGLREAHYAWAEAG